MINNLNLIIESRRWYISIVPMKSPPGTTKDIDFYAAPSLRDDLPPVNGWICVPNGGAVEPPPTRVVVFNRTDEYDNDLDGNGDKHNI